MIDKINQCPPCFRDLQVLDLDCYPSPEDANRPTVDWGICQDYDENSNLQNIIDGLKECKKISKKRISRKNPDLKFSHCIWILQPPLGNQEEGQIAVKLCFVKKD